MQLFFAGAEVGSHYTLLRECGVTRIAVSAHNLARNQKDRLINWPSKERLGGLEWVLYADSAHTPLSIVTEILSGAEVQPEVVTGPIEWYDSTWLKDSDLLFLPQWDGTDPGTLREFTEDFDGVVLPDSAVDNPTTVRAAKAALPRMGSLGAITGRSKGLERFDLLFSYAWWNTQKYGETHVWTGDRLVRLNAEDKKLKRERYADTIAALGCNVDAVLLDDPSETARLAIKSWLQLEAHVAAGHRLPAAVAPSEVAHGAPVQVPGNVVPISPAVASARPQTGHQTLPLIVMQKRTTVLQDASGQDVPETSQTIAVAPQSLRQCNTCSLQVGCPSFQPHSPCSYQIPVQISNKAELNGVLRALVEIQTQRILMGRFSEEINGNQDDQVGREMDRLFQMVERWRNIEESRDRLKITVDGQGSSAAAGMGVLSRLFGEKAGQNALALEDPIDSDEIIEEMTDD